MSEPSEFLQDDLPLTPILAMTRPYICHKAALVKVCQVNQQVLARLRQMAAGAFPAPLPHQQQMLLNTVQTYLFFVLIGQRLRLLGPRSFGQGEGNIHRHFNLFCRIDAATATTQNFLAWIDTNPISYQCDGDPPLAYIEQPGDVEVMRLDMNKTPRWLIKAWLPLPRSIFPLFNHCAFSPYQFSSFSLDFADPLLP